MSATPQIGVPAGSGEVRIPVQMPDGVRCSECIERLRSAIEQIDGVHAVVVDARTWTLSVNYDPDRTTPEGVESASRGLGLEIGQSVAHAAYRLTGLD
ncbi:MAG: heavy-metal-associated domain-containing protein [Anaerosomatales bacterium]